MNATTDTTARNFLSLAEFRASQKWCDDLVQFGTDDGIKGFVYADCCYIEQTGSTPMDAHFQLIIERSEWDSDAIEGLESILWAEHYLFDTADVVLSVDDGTLDDFVRAVCAAYRKPVDGDLFGVLFSGKPDWTPSEAHEIIVNSFTYASADDAALPVAERLQLMADRKADDVPTASAAGVVGVQSGLLAGGGGVQSATFALALTESELSNLITACNTSAMRKDSPEWQAGLDALAVKLRAARGN